MAPHSMDSGERRYEGLLASQRSRSTLRSGRKQETIFFYRSIGSDKKQGHDQVVCHWKEEEGGV